MRTQNEHGGFALCVAVALILMILFSLTQPRRNSGTQKVEPTQTVIVTVVKASCSAHMTMSLPSTKWWQVSIQNLKCDRDFTSGKLKIVSVKEDQSLDSQSIDFTESATPHSITSLHCFNAGGVGYYVTVMLAQNGLVAGTFKTLPCTLKVLS